MRIHDISVTITPQLVTWADSETNIVREWKCRIDEGGPCNGSTVTLGSHCGTHLDAPLHFIDKAGSVSELALDDLIGPCHVIEIPDLDHLNITAADLDRAQLPADATRLLFKTSNTRRRLLHDPKFHEDFVGIAPDGARRLVQSGVRTVGIDYLSVGAVADGSGGETHRIMLAAGQVLLEGLLLDDVPPGQYTLIALPLKIEGAEGCPMRAVLTTE